ncbi:DMT family transporter, partial [Gluconobacter cerinus]
AIVGALLLWRGERTAFRSIPLRPIVSVGTLFGLEFLLTAEGLRFTSAAHMSIFLYTAPIFAALGLHIRLPEERLSLFQWSGILVAFLGVVISFIGPAHKEAAHAHDLVWLGDLMGIMGAMAWGMTTLVVRTTPLADAPATVTLFCQLAGAGFLLLSVAVLAHQTTFHTTSFVLLNLGFQTIIISALSYLVWFSLLRRYLASRLGVLSFMTPVFGVASGALLLHEALTSSFLIGALMILGGIMVVSGESLFKGKGHTK